MNRRGFLKLAGTLPAVSGFVPDVLFAAGPDKPAKAIAGEAAKGRSGRKRVVVLVKLSGGNDGLNTLVPRNDKAYKSYKTLRPQIFVPDHKLSDFALDDGMSVNPYMLKLKKWQDNTAWIQGVGYPHAVLSHFRSSDIWETASSAFEQSEMGWLARILPQYKKGLHGIILGEGLGPMAGKDCHTIAMQSPSVFLNQVDLVDDIKPAKYASSGLTHIVNIQHQLHEAGEQLKQKMSRPRPIPGFSTSTLGRRLESVAQMIISGVDTGVYKVEHSGYDTHAKQLHVHNNLLFELAAALDSFATTMQQHGLWDDVLVMTYSEFGRRVEQNRGYGTDHGAASMQLVMGGRVRGDLYGENPRLHDLDKDGNLPMTTDFRAVYGTLASRWFGVSNPWHQFGTVKFV